MPNDLLWFAYLCVDKGLITKAICRQIGGILQDRMDLLFFAETLLANNFCSNQERVQALINEAWRKDQEGAVPPDNVFVDAPPSAGAPETRRSIPLKQKPTAETSHTPPPPPGPREERKLVLKASVSRVIETIQFGTQTQLPKPDLSDVPDNEAEPSLPSNEAPPSDPESTVAAEAPAALTDTGYLRAPTLTDIDVKVLKGEIFDFAKVPELDDQELKKAMVKLLLAVQERGGSDLHVSAGARPFMRVDGQVDFLADHVLPADDAMRMNTVLLDENQRQTFADVQDLDFALAVDEKKRYRVNLMVHKDGAAGTYRIVPSEVKTLEGLGFANADVIRQLLAYHNGLILVTGPTGSGKTATMAALVGELNQNRQDHIITVENPIEVVQRSAKCNITQREVGRHTASFKAALKAALREDPDIIVIGELRDLETIEMAITASETGHLVIGTLHTADASTTLNRILDVFPPAQQPQIRAMVAQSLRGIICQRLLPSKEGGRIVACELLLNTLAVSNLIREGKSHALKAVLETGARQGMCLMDNYILGLWQDGRISDQVANLYIRDRGVRNRIKSMKQLGDAGAQAVQTLVPGTGHETQKKKWGLFG